MTRSRPRLLLVALLVFAASFAMGQSCSQPLTPQAVVNDADGDSVPAWADNCRDAPNRQQRNTNVSSLEYCVGADAQPDRENRTPPVYGSCANDGADCLLDSDCHRGDACDCDFDANGTCNIDDFNVLLGSLGTAGGQGTDMNEDGVVDDLDFDVFEPLFAAGRPGAGRLPERVTEGGCYDAKWSRLLYPSSGRNSGPNLACSVAENAALDFLLSADKRQALQDNPDNPTDAYLEIRGDGANKCPNTAFATSDKTDPRACDAHDLCGSRCGRVGEECNVQFYRDLFHTCEALTGQERSDCRSACLDFASYYATAIATGSSTIPKRITAPPPDDAGTGPTARDLLADELNCQCGPPVCVTDSDCAEQLDQGASVGCRQGYCVQKINGKGCTQSSECPNGHLCDAGDCVWNPQAPDRLLLDLPPPVCGDGVCEQPIESCMANGCPEDCGRCLLGDACELTMDCGQGGCLHGSCQLLPDGAACTDGAMCANDSCGVISRQCSSACTLDSECGSGVCHLFQCVDPLPPGTICDSGSDCESGICASVCLADALDPGTVCLLDAQCASGTCTAGFCDGSCGDGFCTLVPDAEGCITCAADCGLCSDGTVGCVVDAQCASGDCRGGFCGGVPNGELCISNSQCASGVCNNAVCVSPGSVGLGGICTTSPACGSGTCTAGFCVCDSSSDCPSGKACVAAVCVTVPSCASNGTTCALNSACCSGRCDGVPPVCKSKLGNGSSCNENSDCQSGDCGDCNIFGTSCECT